MNMPENLNQGLALLNALLNASTATMLLLGFRAIRRREIASHQRFMATAFIISCVFLCSYLTRMALFGDTRFGGTGTIRTFYLSLLASHVLLAIALVPMVLRTLFLASKRRDAEHRRLARFTWPVWMYVSVTGVLVYLMLYQLSVS